MCCNYYVIACWAALRVCVRVCMRVYVYVYVCMYICMHHLTNHPCHRSVNHSVSQSSSQSVSQAVSHQDAQVKRLKMFKITLGLVPCFQSRERMRRTVACFVFTKWLIRACVAVRRGGTRRLRSLLCLPFQTIELLCVVEREGGEERRIGDLSSPVC